MTVDTRDNVILADFQEQAAEELAAGNVWITAATEEEIVAGGVEPANLPGVQFVSLKGRVGSWDANQGNRDKTTPPVAHYNGPATGIPSGADPVARLIGSARYHMQIDWGGGARANGLQYHSAVWDDVIFLCRNPLSILWHCGHAYNYTSHACHVPIGGNERATAQTLRTLKLWFDEINRTWGTRGAYGHKELSSTACPGTLQSDFVAKYRAGHDFGVKPAPKPTPKPDPAPVPEKPPVDSLWLPNIPRIAFEDYEEKHLDERPRVLTLDGKDRAAIVPRGMAMLVPKPDEKPPVEPEKPAPKPEPEPEPKPPTKDEPLSLAELNAIYDVLPDSEYARRIDGLNECLRRYDIRGPHRISAFLGNLAAESACLKYVREIHDGSNYEGRRDLGNIHPGDGRRFRGRGYIQITGRANYTQASKELGYDFVSDPEAMESPKWAAIVSGWFWHSRGLNHFADQGNPGWPEVCRRINGRYPANGQAERNKYYARAWDVLVADDPRWNSVNGLTDEEEDMEPRPQSPGVPDPGARPKLSKAAKAIIAAVVPLVLALLMFAHTGVLNEAELSVALSGFLTALFVYFVPNTDA